MGAYLFYKVATGQGKIANTFLAEQPEHQKLLQMSRQLYFDDQSVVEWAKANNPSAVQYFIDSIDTGEWKASGICEDAGIEYGVSYTDIFEYITVLLEKLRAVVSLKVYTGSCALDEGYFTVEQLRRITDNGKLLSSRPIDVRQKIIAIMQ